METYHEVEEQILTPETIDGIIGAYGIVNGLVEIFNVQNHLSAQYINYRLGDEPNE